MMGIRVFVGLALILLCLSSVYGSLTSTGILVKDAMVDATGQRKVVVDIKVTTTASAGETTPQICSGSAITVTPSTNWNTPVLNSATCGGSSCAQTVTLTSTSTPCPFSGSFTVNFMKCGNGATTSSDPGSVAFNLQERSVCSDSLYSFTANISSFGAYADAAFSQTKSHYYINDMVFFPFHVIYTDLTIASLTFNTITVDSDTSSAVVLYSSSSNTGAGNVVNLKTSALSSQLSSGVATMWFGLELNREEGSPFANAPSSVTPYTFSVVFDITYKNTKRSLIQEDGQLHSKATIMVSNREAAPVLSALPQMLTGAGHVVKGGVLGLLSFLLGVFLYF